RGGLACGRGVAGGGGAKKRDELAPAIHPTPSATASAPVTSAGCSHGAPADAAEISNASRRGALISRSHDDADGGTIIGRNFALCLGARVGPLSSMDTAHSSSLPAAAALAVVAGRAARPRASCFWSP